jgi:hypothetical protein
MHKNLLFTAVKHISRIFTCVLPDYFLINFGSSQNFTEILLNSYVKIKNNVYNKQKIQVFFSSKNTGYIFILWYEIIIFHSWLPSLMKYIFSYHSMKINPVFRANTYIPSMYESAIL